MSWKPAEWTTIANLGINLTPEVSNSLDSAKIVINTISAVANAMDSAMGPVSAFLTARNKAPWGSVLKAGADLINQTSSSLLSTGMSYICIHPLNRFHKRKTVLGFCKDFELEWNAMTPMEAFAEFKESFTRTADKNRPTWPDMAVSEGYGILITADNPADLSRIGKAFNEFIRIDEFSRMQDQYSKAIKQYANQAKGIGGNIVSLLKKPRVLNEVPVTSKNTGLTSLDAVARIIRGAGDEARNSRVTELKVGQALVGSAIGLGGDVAHWTGFKAEDLKIFSDVNQVLQKTVNFLANAGAEVERAELALIKAVVKKVKKLSDLVRQSTDIITKYEQFIQASRGLYYFYISKEAGGVKHITGALDASMSESSDSGKLLRSLANNQFSALLVVAWGGGIDNDKFMALFNKLKDRANEAKAPYVSPSKPDNNSVKEIKEEGSDKLAAIPPADLKEDNSPLPIISTAAPDNLVQPTTVSIIPKFAVTVVPGISERYPLNYNLQFKVVEISPNPHDPKTIFVDYEWDYIPSNDMEGPKSEKFTNVGGLAEDSTPSEMWTSGRFLHVNKKVSIPLSVAGSWILKVTVTLRRSKIQSDIIAQNVFKYPFEVVADITKPESPTAGMTKAEKALYLKSGQIVKSIPTIINKFVVDPVTNTLDIKTPEVPCYLDFSTIEGVEAISMYVTPSYVRALVSSGVTSPQVNEEGWAAFSAQMLVGIPIAGLYPIKYQANGVVTEALLSVRQKDTGYLNIC